MPRKQKQKQKQQQYQKVIVNIGRKKQPYTKPLPKQNNFNQSIPYLAGLSNNNAHQLLSTALASIYTQNNKQQALASQPTFQPTHSTVLAATPTKTPVPPPPLGPPPTRSVEAFRPTIQGEVINQDPPRSRGRPVTIEPMVSVDSLPRNKDGTVKKSSKEYKKLDQSQKDSILEQEMKTKKTKIQTADEAFGLLETEDEDKVTSLIKNHTPYQKKVEFREEDKQYRKPSSVIRSLHNDMESDLETNPPMTDNEDKSQTKNILNNIKSSLNSGFNRPKIIPMQTAQVLNDDDQYILRSPAANPVYV